MMGSFGKDIETGASVRPLAEELRPFGAGAWIVGLGLHLPTSTSDASLEAVFICIFQVVTSACRVH